MKLYTITDCHRDDDLEGAWFAAVWAETQEQAIAWGVEHYSGDCHHADKLWIRVINDLELPAEWHPSIDPIFLPSEECRFEVLRLAGWNDPDEIACDCCGLYSLGMPEHEVCSTCLLCPDCRGDEPCECQEVDE